MAAGGELHPTTSGPGRLATNQGVPVAGGQKTLTVGRRGPQLLEEFILREKITPFDLERIRECVVHPRGYVARGYFQCYEAHAELTNGRVDGDWHRWHRMFSRVAGQPHRIDEHRGRMRGERYHIPATTRQLLSG